MLLLWLLVCVVVCGGDRLLSPEIVRSVARACGPPDRSLKFMVRNRAEAMAVARARGRDEIRAMSMSRARARARPMARAMSRVGARASGKAMG